MFCCQKRKINLGQTLETTLYNLVFLVDIVSLFMSEEGYTGNFWLKSKKTARRLTNISFFFFENLAKGPEDVLKLYFSGQILYLLFDLVRVIFMKAG